MRLGYPAAMSTAMKPTTRRGPSELASDLLESRSDLVLAHVFGSAVRMRAAVGFRNVAVLACQRLDRGIVHAISHEGLQDFERFAARLAAKLEHRSD